MKKQLTIKFRSSCGNGTKKVKDLKEAQSAHHNFLNKTYAGVREFNGSVVYEGEEIVAHLSYNGRLWKDKKYTEEIVLN